MINTKKPKIAVLGDIALDFAFFTSQTSELSVETGLAVKDVKKYTYDCGATANLAADIASLGVDCDLYGVVGDDIFAEILTRKLEDLGVETKHIRLQSGFTTFVYHKVYNAAGEELPRYDLGKFNVYINEIIEAILEDFKSCMKGYDAIVLSQQFPNSIHNTIGFRNGLSVILKSFEGLIWIDSRNGLSYPNASYKLNQAEAFAIAKCQDITNASYVLLKTFSPAKNIVITMGPEGAYGTDGTQHYRIFGINDVKKTDPVGAGDAFMAGLVVSQICGKSFQESLEFANANATISARILFATGHPTHIQTKELLSDPDYRYNPVLAKDPRKAKYLESTDIEIVNDSIISNHPKAAIFDHDGTISTMRHGWEKIMRNMMVRAIAGDRFSSLSLTELDNMYSNVDQMIEKTTGIQTIIQMNQLVGMIKEYGYVPEKKIKTPLQYKDDYRTLLNEQLKFKYRRFKDGIYSAQDFTMKGVIDFLKELGNHGTKVFLASGSDYSDVKYETQTLGYDYLFTGGIYGSVGDLSKDPKKMVMSEIIKKIEACPTEVVVFGDGPVEMREAKKHGFLAVGIVSDEHQRFGINIAKRERLILAGADLLIPDFSWMKKLEDYLGWKK